MHCDKIPLLEFIRGELSDKQTMQTLAHIEKCQTCRERVTIMALLEKEGVKKGRQRPHRRQWSIAASILLALSGLTLLLFQYRASSSLAQLAEQFAYPATELQTRSATINRRDLTGKEALEQYRAGNFAEAAHLFSQCVPTAEIHFFWGVSLYMKGDPREAIPHFETVRNSGITWAQAAAWYEANAYLLLDQEEPARRLLQTIVHEGGTQADRAKALLSKIESLP